jgi:hypothetical protein
LRGGGGGLLELLESIERSSQAALEGKKKDEGGLVVGVCVCVCVYVHVQE